MYTENNYNKNSIASLKEFKTYIPTDALFPVLEISSGVVTTYEHNQSKKALTTIFISHKQRTAQ